MNGSRFKDTLRIREFNAVSNLKIKMSTYIIKTNNNFNEDLNIQLNQSRRQKR
jgi:hypothetical protein